MKDYAEYIDKVHSLWYSMYQPHTHPGVCGYVDEESGKYICVFQSVRTGRSIHVYLNEEKGILMPFFPPKR